MDSILNLISPHLGQVSFGGLAGFASGYALKKIGRVAAVVLGLLFISVQMLAYFGVLQINWLRIEEVTKPVLAKDNLGALWQGLLAVLTHNVPFAAAFVPGLLLGLRYG